jgi:hypothetical protein
VLVVGFGARVVADEATVVEGVVVALGVGVVVDVPGTGVMT